MVELIYKNELCNAKYDRISKLVRTQYVGIVKVDAITDLLRKVMEFSGKEQVNYMIANLTEMQGTFTGALDFFEKEFYPTMIRNGLYAYASTLSKDAFTKYAAAQLQKKVGGKLEWHAFSTVLEAENWMHAQINRLPHAQVS
jgi:hypothetical protein